MSSTKNKTETKSKVDTCCSEPAKRKLLIKIGVGVGVATVLLVVIIAVAVVMATKPEDESSNPSVTNTESSGTNDTSQTSSTTTVCIVHISDVIRNQIPRNWSVYDYFIHFYHYNSKNYSQIHYISTDKKMARILQSEAVHAL